MFEATLTDRQGRLDRLQIVALVGLMFLVEYLVRLKLLPEDRSSILDAVRAYRRSSPTATPVNEQ